jgi:hypothetical protein
MCTVLHNRYGSKRRLRRKSCDCNEIAVPQRFPCKHGKTLDRQIVVEGEQLTARKLAIRTPFSLMTTGKNPSQMNPLASKTLGEFRSVEIQASVPTLAEQNQLVRVGVGDFLTQIIIEQPIDGGFLEEGETQNL